MAFARPRDTVQVPKVQALDSLERVKNLATIFSAIAIPIVLTIAGYFIQRQLADDSLKKDYVGIAAGILKENPTGQEPELRAWAVRVLDENSPLPFSQKAREGLRVGPVVVPPPIYIGPPEACLTPPPPRNGYAALQRLSDEVDGGKALTGVRLADFIDAVVQDMGTAAAMAIQLKCLIDWARQEEQADIEFRKRIGAPSSKSVLEQLRREAAASAPASPASAVR